MGGIERARMSGSGSDFPGVAEKADVDKAPSLGPTYRHVDESAGGDRDARSTDDDGNPALENN